MRVYPLEAAAVLEHLEHFAAHFLSSSATEASGGGGGGGGELARLERGAEEGPYAGVTALSDAEFAATVLERGEGCAALVVHVLGSLTPARHAPRAAVF